MVSRKNTRWIRRQEFEQALAVSCQQRLWRTTPGPAGHLKRTLAATSILLVLGVLAFVRPYLAAAKDKHNKKDGTGNSAAMTGKAAPNSLGGLPFTELTPDEAIAHALNRLGFGPRPGDVDQVRQMGLAKWIDRQLHPESIDDSAMDARLQRFPTLAMSSEALLAKFPRPQLAAKRAGITPEQYRKQQQEKLQATPSRRSSGIEFRTTGNGGRPSGNSTEQRPCQHTSQRIR